MLKPLMQAGTKLLLVGFITALLGWSQSSTALPLVGSLSLAGAQDEEETDDEADEEVDEEADEEQAEEDQAEEDQAEGDEEEADTQDDVSADAGAEEADDVIDIGSDSQDVAGQGESAQEAGADAGATEMDDDAELAGSNEPGDDDGQQPVSVAAVDEDSDMPMEDDYEDDSWASSWEVDETVESDDAIPLDDAQDEDLIWEVLAVADDEGAESDNDSVGTGTLLPVRSGRQPPRSNRKPQGKPVRPGDDDDTVYAYGGRPVLAMSVPWQAQILYPGAPAKPNDKRPAWQRQHYCGGALIAPDWVVTAAHCIDQQMVDVGFKVRLGAQDISKDDGITYKIDRIVRHSQYNAESNDVNHPPNMYANDIALIRIVPEGKPASVDPKRIRQIPVNQKPLAAGVPVSATGWGVTGSENADAINAVMLRVDLQLMPNQVCQQRPGYGPQKIKDAVFCASNPVQSTCRGDSGGPVVLTNGSPTLVGLVSWGKRKCAGDGRPGVYTRIDRYAQWIDQAMKLPAGRNSLP